MFFRTVTVRERRGKSKVDEETEGECSRVFIYGGKLIFGVFGQQYRRSLIFDNRIFDGQYLLQVFASFPRVAFFFVFWRAAGGEAAQELTSNTLCSK